MAQLEFNMQSELNGKTPAPGAICIEVEKRIRHPEEINKAQYNPFKPNVIATTANNGNVYLWDYLEHPESPISDEFKPILALKGNEDVSFALEWNSKKKGTILSASNSGECCIWDIEKGTINKELEVEKGKHIS